MFFTLSVFCVVSFVVSIGVQNSGKQTKKLLGIFEKSGNYAQMNMQEKSGKLSQKAKSAEQEYSAVGAEKSDVPFDKVAVLGTPFGTKIYTQGVLIIKTESVESSTGTQNPAKSAGIEKGDYILSVNGYQICCNEDLSDMVVNGKGKDLVFSINRGGKIIKATLTPVLDISSGLYRAGIWVRDSSAGVGTLTFYSPALNVVCGLGHGVYDTETDSLVTVQRGQMVPADIISVQKGKRGTPGELKGKLKYSVFADITLNSENGVYGTPRSDISENRYVDVAATSQIKSGDAVILCTISDDIPKEYSCKIKINSGGIFDKDRDITVTVTDKSLIEKTGGIVQGMSGSPILQNGKLIGAVTHVLVDDPTTGYAIFAENMLETAQSVANENKLKDAS